MKTGRGLVLSWLAWLVILGALAPGAHHAAEDRFCLREIPLVIPQVDYEGAIYYQPGDPLPRIDLEKVRWDRVVQKEHRAVVMTSQYLEVTVLPQMGRVYSMVFRPTGHEVLWRNDIVRPGGGNNETGWWLWIGGIAYTLPGDEHGTTWALPWTYRVLEDSPARKAVRMQVTEPTTGLVERIDLSLYPEAAGFEADIRIANPGADTVSFAHWVNPQWVPGGRNELSDSTEFIIPTPQIRIEERWQANLGPSPQPWPGNPLRCIRNWKMGDIMADGLEAGFYAAYAHDAGEGVVRVFDPATNPGVDMWTYGFHPREIPMGSGAPNKGYAEMWGGTVATFPHERRPLAPGQSIAWTEWMYPFQQTEGLTFANQSAAVTCRMDAERVQVIVCPARALRQPVLVLRVNGRELARRPFAATPASPFRTVIELEEPAAAAEVLLLLEEGGVEVLRCRAEGR